MRKLMIIGVSLLALSVPSVAAAKKPVVVREGNRILTINGDVFPVALPEDKPAPITVLVSGGIATTDGSQPPAVRKVVIETAKDGYVNVEGLPTCSFGRLTARSTTDAERACPTAIVGRGQTTARVAFPEQKPFNARGKVVAFNGGEKGGVITLFIDAYLAVPTPTAVVTTVKIHKIHGGPYGLRSIATVPVIAGGAGSLVDFDLTLHRTFAFHGERRSFLEGECSHDKLLAHVEDTFSDGTHVAGTLVRPCKVRH